MNESLIKKLCDDLHPVKKMRHPCCCLAGWFGLIAVILGGFIWYLGLRPDFAERMIEPVFLFEMGLALLMGLSAALCSFWLRFPDMRGAAWMMPVPLTLLGVFIFWTLIRLLTADVHMPSMEFHHCMGVGVIMMVVPSILMFLAVFQGCTTHPALMAVMNGLTIAALGYLALRLTCHSESMEHILFTHVLPFILLGGVAGFVARRFYKW